MKTVRWFRAWAVLLLAAAPGVTASAAAPIGLKVLDEPAIMVRAPSGVFLEDVTCAGSRLVAVGEHGVIIYSDDNGATWRQAQVPVSADLNAVRFASPGSGWAVGHYGVILHSGDAGATWQVQLNGIQANQLTAQAAARAVATNDPSPGTARAMVRAQHFLSEGPDKPFLALWAPDARHAIAFGAYRLAMRTADGGRTWQDWSLHLADPLSHNIYAVAQTGPSLLLAAETGLVFASADGGQSFAAAGQPASATLFGATDAGGGTALVVGVAGQAFAGPPDGANWRPVTIGHGTNLTCTITLRDGAVVVAGEDGTLYVSRDHAQSFRQVPQSLPMAIAGLAQAPSGDLIVVGSGGARHLPATLFSPS